MNAGNTRRVDEPRLSQRAAGLSGPALFSQTLETVRRLREKLGACFEIIATGGTDSPETARAALRSGGHRVRLLHRVHHPGAVSRSVVNINVLSSWACSPEPSERLTFGSARHSLGPRRPMMPSQPRTE